MRTRLAWALAVALFAGVACAKEGGGAKRTSAGGEVVKVDGWTVTCQQKGDGGTKEASISCTAKTDVVVIDGWNEEPGEGGKMRKVPVYKASSLADLKAGMRIRATLVDGVATRIEVQPAAVKKEGREGGR